MEDQNEGINTISLFSQRQNNCIKFDILFYRSYQKVKHSYIIILTWKIFLFVISIGLLIYNLIDNTNVFDYGIYVSICTLLHFSIQLYFYYYIVRNIKFAFEIAKLFGNYIYQYQIGQSSYVSNNIYNAVHQIQVNNQNLNAELMQRQQNNLSNIIKVYYRQFNPCRQKIEPIVDIYTLAILIIGIVIIISSSLNQSDLFLILMFIAIVSFSCLKLVIAFIFLGLFLCFIPVICIIFCFYACFCYQSHNIKLPQAQLIQEQIINEVYECSICQKAFAISQKLITLQCSKKHIFHKTCIETWVKINPTCPICRTPIQ